MVVVEKLHFNDQETVENFRSDTSVDGLADETDMPFGRLCPTLCYSLYVYLAVGTLAYNYSEFSRDIRCFFSCLAELFLLQADYVIVTYCYLLVHTTCFKMIAMQMLL